MPGDDSMEQQMAELRAEIAKISGDVNLSVSKIEAEVRVCKHDITNLNTMFNSLGRQFDKFEQRISEKLDLIGEKISGLNSSQAKGFGYFAGIGTAITLAGTILMTIAAFLFGAKGH